MPDTLTSLATDALRQFPVAAITLVVGWFFFRYVSRQHARELSAKNDEISRLVAAHEREIQRVIEERKKYFQMFLKEVEASRQNDRYEGADPPASRERT